MKTEETETERRDLTFIGWLW